MAFGIDWNSDRDPISDSPSWNEPERAAVSNMRR
jgi:hypothetical protein